MIEVATGPTLAQKSCVPVSNVAVSFVVPPTCAGSGKQPRKRTGLGKHQMDIRADGASLLKAQPIWLGSGSRDEAFVIEDIQNVVAIDMVNTESIMAIGAFEAEAEQCLVRQEYVAAAERYEQAVSIRRKFLGDSDPNCVSAVERFVVKCNHWGIECLNAGKFTSSLELLKKAEAMTDPETAPNFMRRISLRAATFNNLCCYFRQRGKVNAALQFAEKALKIEERFKYAENPARTHLNYAVLLSTINRHAEAVEHIESSIAVLVEEIRQSDRDVIETADQCKDSSEASALDIGKRHKEVVTALVVAYYNMWLELWRMGRRDSSLDFILRAANVATWRLGGTHPLTLKAQEMFALVQEQLPKGQGLAQAFDAGGGHTSDTTSPVGEGRASLTSAACDPFVALRNHEHCADVLDMPLTLTFRCNKAPPNPPPRAPKDKAPFKRIREIKLAAQVHGRSLNMRALSCSKEPLFGSRPKSKDLRSTHLGSPILLQQVHGVTPQIARLGKDIEANACCANIPDVAIGNNSIVVDSMLSQKLTAEEKIAPNLRAAYEYHKLVLQQRELDPESKELTNVPNWERVGAVNVLRDRLARRRSLGLGLPTCKNSILAATRIQAFFRGYLVRLWSITELANHFRRIRDLENACANFEPSDIAGGLWDMKRRVALRVVYAARMASIEHSAAVLIQKTWRGCNARLDIEYEIGNIAEMTATKIQALIRRAITHKKLLLADSGATIVQRYWRGCSARVAASSRRASALFITCAGKGYIVRLHLSERQKKAVRLQRIMRRFLVRCRFANQSAAALAFQTAYRGWKQRRIIKRMHQAASRGIALVRGHAARKRRRRQQEAACLISRCCRMYWNRRRGREMRAASSRIGASWRGHHHRVQKPRVPSACRIQALYRGWKVRKQLLLMSKAALSWQSFWRSQRSRIKLKRSIALAIVLQKLARFRLSTFQICLIICKVVGCQRIARGVRARLLMDRQHSCATCLQMQWRSWQARRLVVLKSVASQRIQRFFRLYLQKLCFKSIRKAAISIQGGWHGHTARCTFYRRHIAALRISASYRMHLVCVRHQRARKVTKLIQQWWRNVISRQLTLRRRLAATKIQAAVRCKRQLTRFKCLRDSLVLTLQATWRARLAKRIYKRQQLLAVKLQALWRTRCTVEWLRLRGQCAIAIQCFWRVRCCERSVLVRHLAALKIQTVFIGLMVRRHLAQQRDCARLLQRHMRGYLYKQLSKREAAARRLVAWMHGRMRLVLFRREREAAVVLQKYWRGYQVHSRITSLRQRINNLIVKHNLHKAETIRAKQRRAVTLLQRMWRGIATRRHMRRSILVVLHMQRISRRWLAARAKRRQSQAAIEIQKRWRGLRFKRWFGQVKRLQVCVCRLLRCVKTKTRLIGRRKLASTSIYDTVRVWWVRRGLAIQCLRAIVVQRFARGMLARRRVHHMRYNALLPIQCYIRRRKAVAFVEGLRMQAYREEMRGAFFRQHRAELVRFRAATLIQSCQRMRRERNAFVKMLRWALPFIQAFNRMIIERKEYRMKKAGVVLIQSCIRSYRMCTVKRHLAAFVIQQGFRHYLITKCAQRTAFDDFALQTGAAIKIQGNWRRYTQRWLYMRKVVGSIRIQASIRMYLARKQWLIQRNAAKKCQVSCLKMWLALKDSRVRKQKVLILQGLGLRYITRLRQEKRVRAAIKLQSAWRRSMSRSRHKDLLCRSIVKIQAQFRMFYNRKSRYPRRKAALARIQAASRGFLVRRDLRRRHEAAKRIQHKVRLSRFRRVMQIRRCLALSVQSLSRGRWVRKHWKVTGHRLRRMPAIAAAILFRTGQQRLARMAIVAQSNVRGARVRHELARRQRLALLIQTHWRRYMVQRRLARQKSAIAKISSYVRMHLLQKTIREKRQMYFKAQEAYVVFEPIKARKRSSYSAKTVQRYIRGFLARKYVQRTQQSATRIQQTARVYLARCVVHRRLHALSIMQVSLDKTWLQSKFLRIIGKVIRIQAFTKMRHRQRYFRSCQLAQRTMARVARGHLCRLRLTQRLQLERVLIYGCRMLVTRMQYRKQRISVVRIQSAWRGWLVREEAREWQAAVLRIAAAWRRHWCWRRYQAKRRAGEVLVSAAITWRHRRTIRQQHQAATMVARAWRKYCARRPSLTFADAARRIQRQWMLSKITRTFRDMVVDILVKAKLLREKPFVKYAKLIQLHYRNHRCRLNAPFRLQRRAALQIQAGRRQILARREAQRLRRLYRMHARWLLSKLVILEVDKAGRLTRYRDAIPGDENGRRPTTKFLLRFVVNVPYLTEEQRAQLTHRMLPLYTVARIMYYRKVASIAQRLWQGYRTRKQIQHWNKAATLIQRQWRMHSARARKRIVVGAVLRAQAAIRGLLQRRRMRISLTSLSTSRAGRQQSLRNSAIGTSPRVERRGMMESIPVPMLDGAPSKWFEPKSLRNSRQAPRALSTR